MLRVLSLAGTSFVLSCFVLVLIGVPVGAQESGGIPPGTAATGVDTDNTNSPPDLIEVSAGDCTVSPGASITLEDGDGTRAVFTDQQRGITISAPNGSPTIVGPTGGYIGDHATFPDADTAFDTDGDYSVVASTGVACGGGGATAADEQYKPGPVNDPKGVMPETVVVRKVPKTGGPPYIALAAVALLSVALIAGRAMLRP
ncbi:MAG: hypothetical protein M3Y38_08295 [Actinomycetota bacterium]|nr:hypothetical protein [Actinomycetota bacterium]